jgi:hypothetical protein
LSEEKKILVCCMLWQWWTRRDKLNAEGKLIDVRDAFGQARYWASESVLHCQKEKDKALSARISWSPPENDILKINCDGSFTKESATGGWGFDIRDSEGSVRGSGAGHLAHVTSAAQAEAIACTEALHAAVSWGMGRVQVESDARNMVMALEGNQYDLAPEGIYYQDIRVFSRLNFVSVVFSFCPRGCNKVAHAVAAKGASSVEARSLWLESLPNLVCVPVTSDSAEFIE